MTAFKPLKILEAPEASRTILARVSEDLGYVPNLLAALAHSPAALGGYVAFADSLCRGTLSPGVRRQIGLRIAELGGSEYNLAAQAALALSTGVGRDAISDGRRGSSPAPRTDAALRFAEALTLSAGRVAAEPLEEMWRAGWLPPEILEVVATTALSLLESYFAGLLRPSLDFPAPPRMPGR